jgi:hypothetical protein
MTVRELKELLDNSDPNMEVCCQVDGDATRTGDYLPCSGPAIVEVFPVSYGGYESAQYSRMNEQDKANVLRVVVIN